MKKIISILAVIMTLLKHSHQCMHCCLCVDRWRHTSPTVICSLYTSYWHCVQPSICSSRWRTTRPQLPLLVDCLSSGQSLMLHSRWASFIKTFKLNWKRYHTSTYFICDIYLNEHLVLTLYFRLEKFWQLVKRTQWMNRSWNMISTTHLTFVQPRSHQSIGIWMLILLEIGTY